MPNEALRYLENAIELLSRSPIEDDTYTDVKYVQEGCGTAYLAVLKAIDGYLMERGVEQKELPQSVEGYREMMREHLTIHNGKLSKKFEALYRELHIAGYYRGLLSDVGVVKEAFRSARSFIEKVGT